MIVSKNNIKFNVYQNQASDGAPFWDWVNDNQWENETFNYLDKYLKPNTGFLDIGAWMGPLTLYAAAKGHECWSFEPDPEAFFALKENVLGNDFKDRIHLYDLAIGDKDGIVGLGLKGTRGDSMSSILLSNPDNLKVRIVKLSKFLDDNNINNISVVKIDIEGYEIMIGEEILKTLKLLNYPTLLLSIHVPLYSSPDLLSKFLDIFKNYYSLEGDDIKIPDGDYPQICLTKK